MSFKMGQVFEPFVFWVDSIVIFCMKIKHPKKKNMTFFVLVISCARDRFKIFILYERFVRVLGRCFSVFHFPFDCAMYPSCCRMRCGAASLFDVSVTKKRKQCEKHERQRGRKRN